MYWVLTAKWRKVLFYSSLNMRTNVPFTAWKLYIGHVMKQCLMVTSD